MIHLIVLLSQYSFEWLEKGRIVWYCLSGKYSTFLSPGLSPICKILFNFTKKQNSRSNLNCWTYFDAKNCIGSNGWRGCWSVFRHPMTRDIGNPVKDQGKERKQTNIGTKKLWCWNYKPSLNAPAALKLVSGLALWRLVASGGVGTRTVTNRKMQLVRVCVKSKPHSSGLNQMLVIRRDEQ